ncbi:MAG: zinc ribbon domain-containing protein [Deltaproteobacteria bacterium]
MKCPKCRFDNPEGMKFCGECGAKIERICDKCGFANPPTFKFCDECGQERIDFQNLENTLIETGYDYSMDG